MRRWVLHTGLQSLEESGAAMHALFGAGCADVSHSSHLKHVLA
jgi:hypothetical protein